MPFPPLSEFQAVTAAAKARTGDQTLGIQVANGLSQPVRSGCLPNGKYWVEPLAPLRSHVLTLAFMRQYNPTT